MALADKNAVVSSKTTPKSSDQMSDVKSRLFAAIDIGDNDRVFLILKKAEENEQTIFAENSVGALVEATNGPDGVTPLFNACKHGNIEVARLLLRAGAQPTRETRSGGFTPLWTAAQRGKARCVELMLQQRGVLVNKVSTDGRTPLYVACESGSVDCVQLLLAAKADINRRRDDRSTPLIVAAVYGHSGVVELLLGAGAKLKPKDEDGTALDNARKQAGAGDRTRCIELLEAAWRARAKDEVADEGQAAEDDVEVD